MLNRWNFLKTGFYEGIKLDARLDAVVSDAVDAANDAKTAADAAKQAADDAKAAADQAVIDIELVALSLSSIGPITVDTNTRAKDVEADLADVKIEIELIELSLTSIEPITVDTNTRVTDVQARLSDPGTGLTAIKQVTDDAVAGVEAIEAKLDARLDVAVSTRAEHRITLNVIEIKDKKRYLIVATEGGEPVDITLDSAIGFEVRGKSTANVGDITSALTPTQLGTGTGVLDIAMDLRPFPRSDSRRDSNVFQFNVEDSHGHLGSITVSKSSLANLGSQ